MRVTFIRIVATEGFLISKNPHTLKRSLRRIQDKVLTGEYEGCRLTAQPVTDPKLKAKIIKEAE